MVLEEQMVALLREVARIQIVVLHDSLVRVRPRLAEALREARRRIAAIHRARTGERPTIDVNEDRHQLNVSARSARRLDLGPSRDR